MKAMLIGPARIAYTVNSVTLFKMYEEALKINEYAITSIIREPQMKCRKKLKH